MKDGTCLSKRYMEESHVNSYKDYYAKAACSSKEVIAEKAEEIIVLGEMGLHI